MSDSDHDLKKILQQEYDMRVRLGYKDPLREVILKHGRYYTQKPIIGKGGKEKKCFHNALHYALDHDLFYCEGYGISGALREHKVFLPMEHGWACDAQGNAFDPTWTDSPNNIYFGIPFTAREAIARCVKKKTYGMFFDGHVGGFYDIKYIKQLDERLAA